MLIMDCLKWTEKQHGSARQRFYGCLDAVCVNFITSEICNCLACINSQAGVCTLYNEVRCVADLLFFTVLTSPNTSIVEVLCYDYSEWYG